MSSATDVTLLPNCTFILCITTTFVFIKKVYSLLFCHRKFINECPSGLITLHEFQRHFCNGTVGSESAEYAEQIFRTLDSNRVRYFMSDESGGNPTGQ